MSFDINADVEALIQKVQTEIDDLLAKRTQLMQLLGKPVSKAHREAAKARHDGRIEALKNRKEIQENNGLSTFQFIVEALRQEPLTANQIVEVMKDSGFSTGSSPHAPGIIRGQFRKHPDVFREAGMTSDPISGRLVVLYALRKDAKVPERRMTKAQTIVKQAEDLMARADAAHDKHTPKRRVGQKGRPKVGAEDRIIARTVEILKHVDHPFTTAELTEALLASGWKSDSADPRASAHASIYPAAKKGRVVNGYRIVGVRETKGSPRRVFWHVEAVENEGAAFNEANADLKEVDPEVEHRVSREVSLSREEMLARLTAPLTGEEEPWPGEQR